MKSPFPGIDPYLEQHWGDVHTRLMVHAANQLNPQLPEDLQARVEESLSVEIGDDDSRTVYPDVLTLEDETFTQRHIQIVDTSVGGRVVSAIEVLSPANKIGREGRRAYQRKQQEYLDSGVNLVEIDLIRAGSFVLAVPELIVPPEYRSTYLICVRRADQLTRAELYRAPLRERLPNVPIPLRPQDRDVVLQLQPLLDACYRDGRYDRTDYKQDPVPPLSAVDAEWADELLRNAKLR